jgi:hypothetical protein
MRNQETHPALDTVQKFVLPPVVKVVAPATDWTITEV